MKTTSTKSRTQKTLAFWAGGKGGLGKTISALTLADTLLSEEIPFAAIDCDQENANKPGALHRFIPAVRCDLRNIRDIDNLLHSSAASETQITLADFPANAGGDFLSWAKDVIQPDILEELNLRVVVIAVVTPEPASLASALSWASALGDTVTHCVVLNRRNAERTHRPTAEVFAEYLSTGYREAFHPIEVEISGLYEPAAIAWQQASVLPSRIDGTSVDILTKARIRRFGIETREAWKAVLPELLGVKEAK